MGMLEGRLTFQRFQASGTAPRIFGPDELEKLAGRAIGQSRVVDPTGGQVGWIAGEHMLDVEFDLAKNIINDTLYFSLRQDTCKLPADLLHAYTQTELRALAANNPSGYPSRWQKKEARQAARDRLEAEAQDGRFIRRKEFPMLWDNRVNQVLIGTQTAGAIEEARRLFAETFHRVLTILDAGSVAIRWAEEHSRSRALSDVRPAEFVPGRGDPEVWWANDPEVPNYLGNEFLLWLWYTIDAEEDTISLPDESEVTVMFVQTLTLECPRGQTGVETIRSDSPTSLPEARQAIRSGKLPRRAGLIFVRHDQQYEFTLKGETLGVSSAKLPAIDNNDLRAALDERIDQIRHLIETIDLLYATFLARRVGQGWANILSAMQRWLQWDDVRRTRSPERLSVVRE
ncbi:MAG: hypothetical protein KatS3mg105_2393 [Gemmatales bacterium]|nr:MAG: hypothetical protein KatS3mg105_2393 [Gemmatales bacterium]